MSLSRPARPPSGDIGIVERGLAQSGQGPSAAVGMNPAEHFQGAKNPSGRGVRLSVRSGFDLSVYDLDVRVEQEVSATTDPCLAVVLLLSGRGTGHIANEGAKFPTMPYRANHLYISMAHKQVAGRACAQQGDPFQLVELRLSIAFLKRTGIYALFANADQNNLLHHASSDALWLGLVPAPQNILSDARSIFTDALSDETLDMRIEACALTLLDNVVSLMISSQPARPGDGVPRERDAARLDEARALMLSDIAHPWTIAMVARAVGLNDRRLKEGFRKRFGSPVHTALQAARLRKGQSLLFTGMSVTQVSLAVGYANPSHFARLFRCAYGMPPSKYR